MKRLLAELRLRHTRADIDGALAALAARIEGDTALIVRGPGASLLGAPSERVARARVEPGVYAETPTSDARVELLARVASLAPVVEVHAPLAATGTFRGRIAFDVPRRLARALGLDAAEPGDRVEGGFLHAFFDDEAIVDEAARAGLRFVARRGAWVELEHTGDGDRERADPFGREVVRAIGLLRAAERLRLNDSPERAVAAMRERGRRERRRGHVGRARLRRAIGWVDAAVPGKGANCFRRVLVEIGLDAGAAEETLVFGLDVGQTGHVAFKDTEARSFDVAFEVTADGSDAAAHLGRR